jgi:hypothetical protein
MRQHIIPVFLALLVLVAACKRADPQPTNKPAQTQAEGSKRIAPEANVQQPSSTQQPSQAATPSDNAPTQVAPAATRPPSIPASELFADDPACVAKLDREEQEFRRDKLPRLIEEEQAVEVFDAWLDSTGKILEAGESRRLIGLLEEGRKEFQACRKDIEPRFYKLLTMMSLPATPGEPRMPHFFCEGNLKGNLEWCSSFILRLGQWDLLDALWTEGSMAGRFCSTGASRREAKADPTGTSLTHFAVCQTLLQSDDCTADGLKSSYAAVQEDYSEYCLAVQAGLKGEACGDTFPAKSNGCALLTAIKDKKGLAGCQDLTESSEKVVPNIFCQSPEAFAQVDCKDFLASQQAPSFRQLELDSCEMARLARTHATDCGSLSKSGPHCHLYNAYRSSILKHSDDKRMETRGKFVFLSRSWARTILQERGVRLASLVAKPGQLGEPRPGDQLEPPPDPNHTPEPPPGDQGPSANSPALLPDLWAEARGGRPLNGPPPNRDGKIIGGDPRQGPPHGSRHMGEPPPSGPPEGEEPPPGAPSLYEIPPGDEAAWPPPRDGKLPNFEEGDRPPLPDGSPPPHRQPKGMKGMVPPGPPPGAPAGKPSSEWASHYGMVPPLYDSENPPEPPGKPGDKPPPDGSRPSTLLVSDAFVDRLTTTGGPIQQAMTEFALDTVQMPGKFRNHEKRPCTPYMLEKKMFPSSDGRIIAQVSTLNTSQETLLCEFHLILEGSEGTTQKIRKATVRMGEVETIEAFFERQVDAKLTLHEACAPAPQLEPKKTAAEADGASPEKGTEQVSADVEKPVAETPAKPQPPKDDTAK